MSSAHGEGPIAKTQCETADEPRPIVNPAPTVSNAMVIEAASSVMASPLRDWLTAREEAHFNSRDIEQSG